MGRDWYIDAFGHPIADVRAKLIEEGWFGRRTDEPARSTDLGWMREEQARPEQAKSDQSPDPAYEQDHGIDR